MEYTRVPRSLLRRMGMDRVLNTVGKALHLGTASDTLFERYKLLALPVVNSDGCLQGIITIDDTLEQLLPPDWRRRPSEKRSKE